MSGGKRFPLYSYFTLNLLRSDPGHSLLEESLSELKEMATTLFSGVSNKDVIKPELKGEPYLPEHLKVVESIFISSILDSMLLYRKSTK
jgi:hypothetical protein